MSKTAMIEISNEELFVFGKQISRHPTFPWLFSITDVYKACEKPIKHQAEKYGKDPEKVFKSKRPGEWLRWNTEDEKIDAAAQRVRIRIKKYGAGCGFGKKKSTASILAVNKLTNRQVCLFSVAGGSSKAAIHGTYVCQDLIVSYAGFLNEKLRASVIDTFISVMNGYTKEVTKEVEKNERKAKGTPEREENKLRNNRLVEGCHRHGVQARPVQGELNRAVLGVSKKEYMENNNIEEPFNDNAPVEVISVKNIGAEILAGELFSAEVGTVDTAKAKTMAFDAGTTARYFWKNLKSIKAAAIEEREAESQSTKKYISKKSSSKR